MLDFNPQLRTRVAYHNDSDAIPVARANGITTVAVMPGGGIFGGQVAVMNLDGWTWEEATLKAERRHSVHISPRWRAAAAAAAAVGGGRPPADRTLRRSEGASAIEGSTRSSGLFDQARAYAKAGAGSDARLVLEALVPVVERGCR